MTYSGRPVQSFLSREITIQWGGARGAGHTGGYTNSRFKYLPLLYLTTRGRNIKVYVKGASKPSQISSEDFRYNTFYKACKYLQLIVL